MGRYDENPFRQMLYIAFLPLLIIFWLYVGFGYYLSFSTAFPHLPAAGLAFIVAAAILVTSFSVRHTAVAWYYARTRVGWTKYAGMIAAFLILFAFSGWAFLSMAMLMFEGPNIARDAVEIAIPVLSKLRTTGDKLLRVPEYEDIRSQVAAYQTSLRNEILNPVGGQYCGVGPSATATIDKLQKILPGIEIINGTTGFNNCNDKIKLEQIARAYDEKITAGLDNLAQRYDIPARDDLRRTVAVALSDQTNRLQALYEALAGLPSFIFDFHLYGTSVAAVEKSRQVYNDIYHRLIPFDKDNALRGLPLSLDIGPIEQISSGFGLPQAIANRLDSFRTYLYIAIALAFDLLICYAAFVVVGRYNESRGSLYGTGVTYLWRPSRPQFRQADNV